VQGRAASSHRAETPSPSDGRAQATTSPILRVLCVALAGIVTLLLLALIVVERAMWVRWVSLIVVFDAICALVFAIAARGRVRVAAWIITVAVWVLFTAAALTSGGVESSAIVGQLVVVVLAGLLLGWRTGVFACAVAVATVVSLAYLQLSGLLPTAVSANTPWSQAITLVTSVVLVGVLQAVTMRALSQARNGASHDAAKRRQAESRLRQVIDNAPFGALGFEVRSVDKLVTTDSNLSASAVLGLDASRLRGMDAETVLAGPGGTAAGREIMRVAHDGGAWETDDFAWRIGKNSGVFEMHAFQTGPDRATLFFSDVTEKRRAEAEIRHMAFHDELTGLPNRALFYDHLHMALASAQRRGDHVGLLFVDLDNFKTLNDRYGHAFGDELLIQVASRLRRSARRGDTVARFGGDEFTVLLPDVESPRQAETVARKLLSVLEEPIEIGNRTISITASLGIAVAPSGSRDAVSLVHQADLAMYHVKADGRGGYRFFELSSLQANRSAAVVDGPSAPPVADKAFE